jgi:hypothetical protein
MNIRPIQARNNSNAELQFDSLIANLLTRCSGLAAVQIHVVYRISTTSRAKS